MKLYGKDELKRRLDNIAEKDRMPHAILFSGNEGSGRKILAKYTAQLFLCEDHDRRACGECAACRNTENDDHPDVIFVKQSCGGKYLIDPFREVLSETVIMPIGGNVKIYVFEDCDTMSPQILNTLLKLIEEPPAHLRFVFTCRNTSIIPETVMSRVTEFEVPDMDAESCARCLEDMGTDPEQAKELSMMFSGNVGKCKAALESDNESRSERSGNKLIEAANSAAAAIGRRDGFGLAAALAGQTSREEFAQVIDLLADMMRGALALKYGKQPEFFPKKEAEKIAAGFSEEEIINILDALFELEKNEIYNLNLALSGAYLTSRIF